MGKVGTQQLNINTILVKVKRGLKEAKRPNFFSWSKRKKRSQNRVIWFETWQVNTLTSWEADHTKLSAPPT